MPWVFNFEKCKKALAEMTILDELSFRFVESFGFRKFMSVKQKLKEALREHRVCLTTNTWTSIQNLNYICLIAHFIDSD